jgi:hypothetical protein
MPIRHALDQCFLQSSSAAPLTNNMASNVLPTALFEGLLLKLVTVLELTRRPEGTATPQAKQALLQAVRTIQQDHGSYIYLTHIPDATRIRRLPILKTL